MQAERRVEVWASGDGWRWREYAANGRIVSESGEAYSRKADALEAAERENPDSLIEISDGATGDAAPPLAG